MGFKADEAVAQLTEDAQQFPAIQPMIDLVQPERGIIR